MFFILFLIACGAATVMTGDDNSGSSNCATLRGVVVCDFEAIDEEGEQVRLSNLRGSPVVLDLSAMWCGPCMSAASGTQTKSEILPGVTFLTVLIEDVEGNPPKANDIKSWKEDFGIVDSPVWGSTRDIVTSNPIDLKDKFYLGGWPSFYFINSSGQLEDYMRGYDPDEVLQKASELQ